MHLLAINFPLSTAFLASHRFWFIKFPFLFVLRNFLISLLISSMTLWLFKSVFSFHVFMYFPAFLLLLIFNFKPLYLEKIILSVISVFFSLLTHVLWPIICSVLENIPCGFDKNVYSVGVHWNVLYVFVRSIWSKIWLKSNVVMLMLCLDNLSNGEGRVLLGCCPLVLLSYLVVFA